MANAKLLHLPRDAEFLYSSYFSISTAVSGSAIASEYNPFDKDSYESTPGYSFTSTSSPDIIYDKDTGRVHFNAPGIYLAIFSFSAINSSFTGCMARFKINGTEVFASAEMRQATVTDPSEFTVHALLEMEACDYLEATVDSWGGGDTDNYPSGYADNTLTNQKGTSLTLVKSNGDLGSIVYTADANAAGSSGAEFIIGDSDNGGTIDFRTNRIRGLSGPVTYDSSTGKLTNKNTRKFLMLSTLMASGSADGDLSTKLYANNSKIQELPTFNNNMDPTEQVVPYEMSLGVLKALTAGQTASARVEHASNTVTVKKGTAFTIFDISSNGTEPSSYLSISTAAVSNALSSGAQICFDSNNYGSYSKTDHLTATGITYTADGGTFVVSEAGAYFLLWNLSLDDTANAAMEVSVKNGSTEIYSAPWIVRSTEDPKEKTICLVVNAGASDSFTFIVTDPNGKFATGTSITMFRVDNLRKIKNIFGSHHCSGPPPVAQISEDFTLNNYGINTLGRQHEIIDTKQPPFIIGTPGPLSLRGRTFASDEQVGVVSDGGKKN